MKNTTFNERFSIETFATEVESRVRTDYERMIEYINREISRVRNMIAIFEIGNHPPLTKGYTREDMEEEMQIMEGERRALEHIKEYISQRLY